MRVHQEGEESVSELTLPAAYWSFGIFGSYSCTAKNRLGTATGYVRLKLATHPHRPNVTACTVSAGFVLTDDGIYSTFFIGFSIMIG